MRARAPFAICWNEDVPVRYRSMRINVVLAVVLTDHDAMYTACTLHFVTRLVSDARGQRTAVATVVRVLQSARCVDSSRAHPRRTSAELNVYCEMHSCLVTCEALQRSNVKGIILSGGPSSVYETGAPHLSVSHVQC